MCDINAVHGLFATGTIEVAPVTFICVCACVCIFCERMHTCQSAYVKIGGQLTGVDFLLPYESWGLNAGCQAWL